MYRIGIIGDRESVLCFKAVGFDVSDTTEYEEARLALENFASKNYAIIYVTEQIAKMLESEIEMYKESPTPAIIVIPNNRGSDGMGMRAIIKSVERAVGADILFKDE
ncbi:MAG: V-type sodium ATPase subunit G [Firmicutes bacterium ADurb.Bin193]|nr:MAG: V-type sodium ATPase subunit G [Firmicutes bacterium ADurb.Bin193]